MNLVIDSSITIRLLTNSGADDLLRKRFASPHVLHAPHLIDAEVASAIRGLLLGRRIDRARADRMISAYSALRITRHPMTIYLPRVMALRDTLTAYDACYVVLAEAIGATLLTLDAKFGGATGHRAEIHVYPYRTG